MTTTEGPASLQGLSSSARLYLEPLSITGGDDARRALDGGWGLPVAGGPLAFTTCRFYGREPEAGAPTHATAPFSVADLKSWLDTGPSYGSQAQAVLERLTAARADLCGRSMDRPRIMGIVNVTPDSFYDGGHHDSAERAIEHGRSLAGQGADFLDIGGESTRPGARPIGIDEELARVRPVIAALTEYTDCPPISIDSRNAPVMAAAIKAGAAIVNDVSALQHDPHALSVAARHDVPVILMHSRGDPGTMQDDPRYDDVLLDVYDALAERVDACAAAGIPRDRLVADPGIGFGKTVAHNLRLMRHLGLFHGLGCPILLGMSRKSTIGRLAGGAPADDRLPGSLAAALWGAARGAQILRVHDVAETAQALAVWTAFERLADPQQDSINGRNGI